MLTTETLTNTDLTPPSLFLERLADRSDQLRMLPAIATEALDIVKDPDCSIEDFTSVVERDVKLAADMLRISNSALYSPATPILNLHRAVVRLGFLECQNLIMAASISSLMSRISLEQEWIRGVLCRHAFNTALLAVHLNRTFHFGFQGEEFTAGLMHDFGRTLMAVLVPETFQELDPLTFVEFAELLEHEEALVGTNHCRLGAWYAVQNELPEPIPEVIFFHHQPELAVEGRRLTALIAVADDMANYLQQFEESDGYAPHSCPFLPALQAFGGPRFETRFCEAVPKLMKQAHRDANQILQF